MATVTVFTCNGATSVNTVALSTQQYGTCQNGQGSWKLVQIQEPFDPSTLNSAQLASAYGAAFVVMATGLVIIWSAKMIIKAIK